MAIQPNDRKRQKHLLKKLPRKAPPLVKRRNKRLLEDLTMFQLPNSYFSTWCSYTTTLFY